MWRWLLPVMTLLTPACATPQGGSPVTHPSQGPSARDLLLAADQTFKSRAYDASRTQYEEALTQAIATGDRETEVEALSQIARTWLITDKREEGRPWLARAAEKADPAQPQGWARYLGVRGRFEWKDGDLPRATATFEEQYTFCQKSGLYEGAIDAAHMVAITAPADQQVVWAHKGIEAAEAGQVTGWLGPLWNNLGSTYEELRDYPAAVDAYRKARTYHYQYGNERNRMLADWALGHALRLAGETQEAWTLLEPCPAWAEKLGDSEFVGLSLEEVGELKALKGDVAGARADLTRALELLTAAGMAEWDRAHFDRLTARVAALSTP